MGRFRYINAYYSIFRHIEGYKQAYSRIIQAHLGILRTLCNSNIFKTLMYLEPEAYLESCQPSTLEFLAKIVNGYNYFRNISFLRFPPYEMNIMSFLKQV